LIFVKKKSKKYKTRTGSALPAATEVPGFRAVHSIKLLIFLIRLYQATFSPFLGSCCRFYPTCSTYMAEALKSHGFFKGAWLGLKRLSKCHPWHRGGHDPIP